MRMAGTSRLLTAKLSLLLAAAISLCLPKMALAQMPPSDSGNYAARVVTAEGQISVLRDAQPWALSIGDSLQVEELIITGPYGHAVVHVSDGSSVEGQPTDR